MTAKVEFKIHSPEGSHTCDLTLRVSRISNGFVIKAGGQPVYVDDIKELVDAIEGVIRGFAKDTDP